MNMFRQEADRRRRAMDALRAEVAGAEGMGTKPQRPAKSTRATGAASQGNSKRKKLAAIAEAQEKAARPSRRKTSAKAHEEPPMPQKEKITKRTSFSFTDSEYERLSRSAHEHYTTMKGLIFMALDLMDEIDALEAESEDS